MRIFRTAKDSHIFSTKNNNGSVIIYVLNFNEMLTNEVVNFMELAPGYRNYGYAFEVPQ